MKSNKDLKDVRSLVKFVQKSVKKAENANMDIEAYVMDELKKRGSYTNSNVSYDATKLSNMTRLTNIIPGALFCMDTYNLMMQQTNGDTKKSKKETGERTKQVVLKLALSAYIVQLSNRLFRNVYNKSLIGIVLVAGGGAVIYETLTRKILKIPVLPQRRTADNSSKTPLLK